ncbi:MAG: hypothetical protein ACE5LU_09870 [Anaerolineae bacterium]
MTSSVEKGLKNSNTRRCLVAILLASLGLSLLLTGAGWYSTTEREPAQAGTHGRQNDRRPFDRARPEPVEGLRTPPRTADRSSAPTSAFAPFLEMLPSGDGKQLFITVADVGEPCDTVFVNLFDIKIEEVPTGFKESYSLLPSDRFCATTAGDFPERMSLLGKINITTTHGVDTEPLEFRRAYVPASMTRTIRSVDGNLELTLVSTDTVSSDTYIAVLPSYGPPGPAPQGHRVVGGVYSVRAADALLVTDKPMSLRLYYNEAFLAGADPHTLAIFSWDAANKHWDKLGGRLFYDQQYVSVATRRFTTYALMATPAWRDDFDDFSGLNFPDEVSNVTLGLEGGDRTLVLLGTATSGAAVSKPITPTTAIDRWDSLTFTTSADPPTTTLTVDVLSVDGTELLTDVTNGASLASIDPTEHPSVKLRANLSSTVAGETPALAAWELTWRVGKRVYLPLIRGR